MTTAKPTSPEVLISGAGPTGLMLALLLARDGIAFRIFDQNAGPAKESRALGLWPKSMELFDSIGLVDTFLECGRPVLSASAYLNGRNLMNINFADIGRDDTPYPFLFILAQSVSEEIFTKALSEAGITIERNTTLTHFERDGAMIKACLKHIDGSEEPVETRYLVGCDGARSEVRKLLNLDFAGGTYDAEFMLADATVDWELPQDRVQMFLSNHSIGMFFPMKGGKTARVITLKEKKKTDGSPHEHLTTDEPLTLDEIQNDFRDTVKHDLSIDNPNWLSRYHVHHRSVERMQVGSVFLAGDAAHIHSPAGGQGMNTGLQDAANLAWKLSAVIKGKAPADILDTYHDERWPVGQKILHFSDRIFSVAISFGSFLSALRNVAFVLMAKLVMSKSFGRRRLFNFASQLNIRYHPNAAVTTNLKSSRKNSKVISGRRAPDAPLKDGSSLLDLMRGYKFTLFVMTKLPVSKQQQGEFEKNWREARCLGSDADIHWIDEQTSPLSITRYQVGETLVTLVRPDGYIGFQSDHLDISFARC